MDNRQALRVPVVYDRDDVQLDTAIIGADIVQLRPEIGLHDGGLARGSHSRQDMRVSDLVASR